MMAHTISVRESGANNPLKIFEREENEKFIEYGNVAPTHHRARLQQASRGSTATTRAVPGLICSTGTQANSLQLKHLAAPQAIKKPLRAYASLHWSLTVSHGAHNNVQTAIVTGKMIACRQLRQQAGRSLLLVASVNVRLVVSTVNGRIMVYGMRQYELYRLRGRADEQPSAGTPHHLSAR